MFCEVYGMDEIKCGIKNTKLFIIGYLLWVLWLPFFIFEVYPINVLLIGLSLMFFVCSFLVNPTSSQEKITDYSPMCL